MYLMFMKFRSFLLALYSLYPGSEPSHSCFCFVIAALIIYNYERI